MQIFGRTITKKGDEFPTSFISVLKDVQKRLDEVEHELWSMKFALDEMTHGKAKYLMDTSVSTSDIANKLQKTHKKFHDLNEDHLKQAREFINTMVENDRKELRKDLQIKQDSLLEFLPHIDDIIPGSSSSQRFFDSADSTNLLKVFDKKVSKSKKKDEFNDFLVNLGPDIKVRRMSRSVSIRKRVKVKPKAKLKMKSKPKLKAKTKIKVKSKAKVSSKSKSVVKTIKRKAKAKPVKRTKAKPIKKTKSGKSTKSSSRKKSSRRR